MFKTIKKYTTLSWWQFIGGSFLTGAAFGVFIFLYSLATIGD